MKKILGILGLFVFVFVVTASIEPTSFLSAYNLQNLIRWTALFGILGIGVAFVIITGGIDLSIGSVVGLVGCLLPMMLDSGLSAAVAVPLAVGTGSVIGLLHGLLITKLRLQPFVVTLCGLLFYRGIARYITDDQTQGFGSAHDGLRQLAIGKPISLASLAVLVGAVAAVVNVWRLAEVRRDRGSATAATTGLVVSLFFVVVGGAVSVSDLGMISEIQAPTPFVILVVLTVIAGVFLNRTVWGRYLFALGRNEQAARYSGIDTGRMVILAYVICSTLAGIGGVLFALDVNSVQPSAHGNFYELYAIAAAVLGGCSLRGGEGSILGVVIGAAVMRILYNSITLLKIPTQLEFAIIGAVILAGVIADELIKRLVARRREAQRESGPP